METKEEKRATAGFIISLIGGIIILINGAWLMTAGSWIAGLEELIGGITIAGLALATIGTIGSIFAILVIIGAVLIYMPGKELIGGIMVLIFSILSIIVGGGFLIGLILGIIGGALGLAKK